jgi:hypothetical protein
MFVASLKPLVGYYPERIEETTNPGASVDISIVNLPIRAGGVAARPPCSVKPLLKHVWTTLQQIPRGTI